MLSADGTQSVPVEVLGLTAHCVHVRLLTPTAGPRRPFAAGADLLVRAWELHGITTDPGPEACPC
jgi:hypothetical protein